MFENFKRVQINVGDVSTNAVIGGIGENAHFYLLKKIGIGSANLAPFTPEALNENLRCFTLGTIHGSCEDYRLSANIDLALDCVDIAAGRKIVCPVLVFWGKLGVVKKCFAPVDDWHEVANEVRGHALPVEHY